MKVKDIMHTVTQISSNSSISDAAKLMDEKVIGSVLVEENNEVIGIMTERDILRKIVAKGKNPDETTVKDIMTADIIKIDANEGTIEASNIMDKNRIRRLIVTENGKIVGAITANSISRNLKYFMAKDMTKYTRPEY